MKHVANLISNHAIRNNPWYVGKKYLHIKATFFVLFNLLRLLKSFFIFCI